MIPDKLAPYAKAVASMVVCAAAYLVGVIPASGGFGDVSVVQWLGLVVFMGGSYGITYRSRVTPKEYYNHGRIHCLPQRRRLTQARNSSMSASSLLIRSPPARCLNERDPAPRRVR